MVATASRSGLSTGSARRPLGQPQPLPPQEQGLPLPKGFARPEWDPPPSSLASAPPTPHIGAISLSSVGLVICRIRASLFPESIPAAKTSSRRASKPRVITRSVSEAVRYPIPRYNFFSLAPDAGSNPSDHSQHLEVLAKGGPVHVKGLCQSPTGAFPEASRVRIGRREGSASATRILTEI